MISLSDLLYLVGIGSAVLAAFLAAGIILHGLAWIWAQVQRGWTR